MQSQKSNQMFNSLKTAINSLSSMNNIPLQVFNFKYKNHNFCLFQATEKNDNIKYVLKIDGHEISELNHAQKKELYILASNKRKPSLLN